MKRTKDWIGWDNIFFSMLVTRKRKKFLGFVCVWKWVISENIHTSYTTDDFHILTPHPLPLPSEFPNCIILPYPRNSIIKIDNPPPPPPPPPPRNSIKKFSPPPPPPPCLHSSFHQTLRNYLLLTQEILEWKLEVFSLLLFNRCNLHCL